MAHLTAMSTVHPAGLRPPAGSSPVARTSTAAPRIPPKPSRSARSTQRAERILKNWPRVSRRDSLTACRPPSPFTVTPGAAKANRISTAATTKRAARNNSGPAPGKPDTGMSRSAATGKSAYIASPREVSRKVSPHSRARPRHVPGWKVTRMTVGAGRPLSTTIAALFTARIAIALNASANRVHRNVYSCQISGRSMTRASRDCARRAGTATTAARHRTARGWRRTSENASTTCSSAGFHGGGGGGSSCGGRAGPTAVVRWDRGRQPRSH